MAESFTRDTLCAWSTRKEATFNTALTGAGDYTTMPIEPPLLLLPQLELVPLTGGGVEVPAGYCPGYWAPTQFTFNPRFDFDMASRFGIQAHGGTITITEPVAATAYKHSAALQTAAQGANLVGRSLAIKNGNLSYLFAGNAVANYAIAQVGGDTPTVEVGILGTTKFTQPVPFTVPAVTLACAPVVTTAIILTDSYGAARDITATEELYGWRFFLNNNADASSNIVRKGSDASQGPTGGTGKYPTKVIRRFPRDWGADIQVNFQSLTGESKAYWEQMAKRAEVTSLTLRIRGDLISGAAYYQVDWIFGEGVWTTTTLQDNDTILAYNLQFRPTDNVAPAVFAVTNITATNFD